MTLSEKLVRRTQWNQKIVEPKSGGGEDCAGDSRRKGKDGMTSAWFCNSNGRMQIFRSMRMGWENEGTPKKRYTKKANAERREFSQICNEGR